ncbi:MAG: aminotransferase class V-fold PLP-dependent enzyme [Rhodobacteraceae bacterium]|nr:aminotransferase class V-fold PLP-dependent enzyme [Paracoccaceae bacterium]
MTTSSGQTYLAIPGPSVIPEEVLRSMHRSAPNIYEGELIEITRSLIPDLNYVARSSGNVAIYIANGHGIWEAALSNIATANDHILVVATGRFAHGWAEMARKLGIKVDVVDFGKNRALDIEVLAKKLKSESKTKYKAILMTHVDTSTSVKNDILNIRKKLDEINCSALLAVDCIASLACDKFEMDEWGVDIMVAACQKGLMVPPGIGFVFFNERARERQKQIPHVSSYWDWAPRINPKFYYEYFCGTAPTHHIYGLRTALNMIKNEEIENTWKRHEILSRAIWAAIDKWSLDGDMSLNVKDPIERSHAVTSIRLGGKNGTKLRQWLQTKSGLTIGIGLGMSEPGDPNGDGFVRFGHMGHVNAQMIMALLGAVEAGLNAIKYKHGNGGLEAASKVLSSI